MIDPYGQNTGNLFGPSQPQFSMPMVSPSINPYGLYSQPSSNFGINLPAAYSPPQQQLALPPPPATPTPPNTVQYQSTQNPEPTDFLATVRQVGGNILQSGLNVLDAPAHYIARPAFELLSEPQVLGDIVSKPDDVFTKFNLIDEAFQRNQAPGIVKFLGETALDPLTYLSAGSLKAVTGAKYIKPLIEAIPGGAATVGGAIHGLEKYEDVIDTAFRGTSNAVSGFAQNYIPLGVAKQNASSVLGKFLPDGLVQNIINAVPDEYTGINISALSGFLNDKVNNLGLPMILKVPEVRTIKTAAAANAAWDAARTSALAHGLNPGIGASDKEIAWWLKDVYTRPQGPLQTPEDGAHFLVADILKRPNPINRTDVNRFARVWGGDLAGNATQEHVLTLNNLVSQYRLSPQYTDELKDATITGIGQLTGVNFNKNPDAYSLIGRFLNGRSDESMGFINKMAKSGDLNGVLDQISGRAKTVTDKTFSMQIAVDRAQNTLLDSFLNRFDNVYNAWWKDGIQKFITFPISKMYLEFTGYPIQNATESFVRHIIGGGGMYAPVSDQSFRIANGLVPNVPRDLLESTGNLTTLASQMDSRFAKSGPFGEMAKWGSMPLTLGNQAELSLRRSFWNSQLEKQIDQESFRRGLGARTDLRDWFDSIKPPDVTIAPELKGTTQDLVNGIANMGIRAVPKGQDAVDAVMGFIDSGAFNRQKVAAIIDRPEFQNLPPQARHEWVNWALNGEASPAAASGAIDKVRNAYISHISSSPEALVEKFNGLNSAVGDRLAAAVVTPDDLRNLVNKVRDVRDQFTEIPSIMRDLEQQAIEKNLQDGTYRQAVHNEFNNRIAQSLDKVSKTQEALYSTLQDKANAMGFGPEVQRMINAMKQDNLLLTKTWGDDSAFRNDFFSGLKRSERQNSATWDGYYQSRNLIWDGYGAQHQALQSELGKADLELQNLIARKNAPPPPIVEEPPAPGIWGKKIGKYTEWQPSSATEWQEIPENTIQPGTGLTYRVNMSSGKREAMQPQGWVNPDVLHPNPEINAQAKNIVDIESAAANNGADFAETAHAIHDRNTNLSGGTGAQPAESAGGNSGGQSIIGGQESPRISGSNIGPSATANPNVPSALAEHYAAANAIRSRLEPLLQDAFNNPAMTPEGAEVLKNHIKNMSQVFESLDQSHKTTLNDVLRSASERTKQIYEQEFTNYNSQTAFDFVAKQIFPFWIYESRRWPYLARTGLKFPGLAAAYNNYMQTTDQGYIPVGELPVQANILRGTILGGVNRATGRDYPLQYTQGLNGALDAIEQTLGKFGFYMGPQFSIPSQLLRGDAGQTVPALLSSALNAGRAMGMPGTAGLQNVLPDQFRDYYVRQILASQNYEPAKVLKAAMDDPNGIEAQIVDTAQRQASLVNVVLQQTGVLRFRTPEYSQYQNARSAAVEKFTGIPIAEQQRLQQLGININQIVALSPDERQQLAAIPGARDFAEVSEPLLSPEAKTLRTSQREFFDAVKSERDRLTQEQTLDDQRMTQKVISGVEWRKRYQDRNGKISQMVDDLKKTEAYKNVPITNDEQLQARQRFNLPAYIDSPVDILLNEYRSIQPNVDSITGDTNWPKFFDDRDAILAKYPPELVAAAKTEIDKNDTPAVRQFRQAMEILRPYFGIKDDILAANPELQQVAQMADIIQTKDPIQGAMFRENNTELKVLNQLVAAYQKQARINFPQLDAALVQYYGATPEVYESMKQSGQQAGNPYGLYR